MLHLEIKDASFECTGNLAISFPNTRALADTVIPLLSLDDIVANLTEAQLQEMKSKCEEALREKENTLHPVFLQIFDGSFSRQRVVNY